MILFQKILKTSVLITLFFLISTCLNFVSAQSRDCMDTIYGEYYEILKSPKQWVKLALTPDTFYLNDLRDGIVKLTLSEDHPWTSTGHYVTVQRWENGRWREVKAPERQVRNSVLKIFGESTQFEHPFSIPVYFKKGELVPGKYRIIKSFNFHNVRNKDVSLSTEFSIVK